MRFHDRLGTVVGAELTPVYPFRKGTAISSSLKTSTAGWNKPDIFVICGPEGSNARKLPASAAEGYLAQNIPLWTSATPAQVGQVIEAYNVSACTPEGGGGPLCCAVAEGVLLDAAMRCPAYRNLRGHAAHSPGTQYSYRFDCCPTCPKPTGGMECICQHTSELQYIFASKSNYQSDNSDPDCKLEPQFRPFSDVMIDRWVGVAATGSHNGGPMGGAAWPSINGGTALFDMDETAKGGPAFTAGAWDSSHCDLWGEIDEAAATAKFGPAE